MEKETVDKRALILGFLLALSILAATTAISYKSVYSSARAAQSSSCLQEAATRSRIIQAEARAALKRLGPGDQKTAQAAFAAALQKMNGHVDKLRALANDGCSLAEPIAELSALLAQAQSQPAAARGKKQKTTPSSPNKALKKIAAGAGELAQEQAALLETRKENLRSGARNTAISIVTGGIISFAILIWIFYLLNREIVERNLARKQLKETLLKLSTSNTELEQFAYIASHDLQEPLRMVTSYVQLLSQRYKGKLDADANEFIAYALDGSTRMQELIRGLLDYSRIDTRKKPFAPVDCNEIMDQAMQDLHLAIEDSGASVTHDALPLITADSRQILQLFENLINNAIKFRKAGRAPAVHVSAEDKWDEWRFSVKDNGIGIDRKDFERIFVIFQRLYAREEYPGTGMGLAICKKIVERHGGRISVASTPGEGSEFLFTLPKKHLQKNG